MLLGYELEPWQILAASSGWPGYLLQPRLDDSGPDYPRQYSLSGLFRASCIHSRSALPCDSSHSDVQQNGIRNSYFLPPNTCFKSSVEDWGGVIRCLKRRFHGFANTSVRVHKTRAALCSRGVRSPLGVTQATSAGTPYSSSLSCHSEAVAAGGRTGASVGEPRDRESPARDPTHSLEAQRKCHFLCEIFLANFLSD